MTSTTDTVTTVTGFASEPFAALRDALARVVDPAGGAALSVVHHRELVVELAAGDYSPADLQLQFSVSKAVAAISAVHAWSAGALDLDRPLSAYWQAFDRAPTRTITPRMVLTHRSGLAGVSQELSLNELVNGAYTDALERQEPFWEPGSVFGYHAFSFGPLLDGIFQRQCGETVGDYFRRNIASPRGLGMSFGATDSDLAKVRPYVRPKRLETPWLRTLPEKRVFADLGAKVLADDYANYNDPDVIQAAWPNSNVVSTASDLARLFAATLESAGSDRVLDATGVNALTAETGRGQDWVLRFPIAYGLGVQLPFPQLPYTGDAAYGHEGAGGCVTFADPDRDIAVSFSTNVFPPCDGASPAALALLSTIRHLVDTVAVPGENHNS